jgi:hypothetical protein
MRSIGVSKRGELLPPALARAASPVWRGARHVTVMTSSCRVCVSGVWAMQSAEAMERGVAGHIGELQLHLRGLYELKTAGGHDVYKLRRNLKGE